jgi:hypothetical protein
MEGAGISPSATPCREWQTRVVGRIMTGVSNSSEIWKPSCTISLASWGLEGSKTGTLAIMAIIRLSCSVWELCGPGSSAEMTRNPPFTPV